MVVTQPDRPRGRGRKLTSPPIKVLADELGLPVLQPESMKRVEHVERLSALAPDLLVVVAWGQILTRDMLDLPRVGAVNLHPSLLPKYRGPAPIHWAVINGEDETGVTTIFLDEGVDTGPILMSRRIPIGALETTGRLHDRLAVAGAELLLETIAGLKNGTVRARPQPETGAGSAPMLKKSDGRIDWTRSADRLAALVRGLDPQPGAYSTFRGQSCKLFGGRAGPGRGRPGQVLALDDGCLHVAAGQGSLGVARLQLAGKKPVPAEAFWHGQHLSGQDCFIT